MRAQPSSSSTCGAAARSAMPVLPFSQRRSLPDSDPRYSSLARNFSEERWASMNGNNLLLLQLLGTLLASAKLPFGEGGDWNIAPDTPGLAAWARGVKGFISSPTSDTCVASGGSIFEFFLFSDKRHFRLLCGNTVGSAGVWDHAPPTSFCPHAGH